MQNVSNMLTSYFISAILARRGDFGGNTKYRTIDTHHTKGHHRYTDDHSLKQVVKNNEG